MNTKKTLAILLVLAMCFSMIPTFAFAEEIEVNEEPAAVEEIVEEVETEDGYGFESFGSFESVSVAGNRFDNDGEVVEYGLTVTFDPNGGSLTGANKVTGLNEGDTIPAESFPTAALEGFTFGGWILYTENNGVQLSREFKPGDNVYASITLVAKWNPILDENVQNELQKGGSATKGELTQSTEPTRSNNPVAMVGETNCYDFAEAVSAVEDGGTITLVDDCNVGGGRIKLTDKSFKVVLNGFTLSSTEEDNIIFWVSGGQTITIDGAVSGSKMIGTAMIPANQTGHISVNKGTYENDLYTPFYANGTCNSASTITVKNATIIATDTQIDSDAETGFGAYIAGPATAEFSSCTITAAKTGVEVRAGDVTISSCTITANGDPASANPNGNGGTVVGAAVAVSQHNTDLDTKVTIKNSGTYTGVYAVYEKDVQNATARDKIVLDLQGTGTYNGQIYSENCTGFITKGNYTVKPDDNYIAAASLIGRNGAKYQVMPASSLIAKVDGENYFVFSNAISAASASEGTMVLQKDVSANSFADDYTISSDITIDLNSHNLTRGGKAFTINEGGSITLTGAGTITGNANRNDAMFVVNGGTLNVGENVVINATSGSNYQYSPVWVKHNGTLNTAGTLTSDKSFAIATDGNSGSDGFKIKVTGGSLSSANASAIYLANNGTLTIENATVTGTTAVYQKCGELTIGDGAILIATGAAAEFVHNGNGCDATGDALVIENCGYPGGVPSASVKDGAKFKSASANPVGLYVYGDRAPVAPTYPTGKVLVGPDADGFYTLAVAVAEVDGIGYTTLNAAIEAAKDGGTVKLLADISTRINISGSAYDFKLDLNGFNIKTTGITITIGGGAKLNIVNTNEQKSAFTENQNAVVDLGSNSDSKGSIYASGTGTVVTIDAGYYYGYNGNNAAIYAYNGAHIIINDAVVNGATKIAGDESDAGKEGKGFYSGKNSEDSAHNSTPGLITINGGEFACRVSTSNWGKYVINGGTFNRSTVVRYLNPVDGNGNPTGTSTKTSQEISFAEAGWLGANRAMRSIGGGMYEVYEHTHTYGEPVWAWNDQDTPWVVTAKFTCPVCGDEVVKNATLAKVPSTEAGYVTYTATAFSPLNEVFTKSKDYAEVYTITYGSDVFPKNYGDVVSFENESAVDWLINNEVRAKAATTFYFAVTGNATVTTQPASTGHLEVINIKQAVGGTKTMTYQVQWSLPATAESVNAVIYRCRDDNSAIDSAEELLTVSNLRTWPTNLNTRNGDYTFNVVNLTSNSTQTIMLRITYKLSGEEKTVDSEISHIAIN